MGDGFATIDQVGIYVDMTWREKIFRRRTELGLSQGDLGQSIGLYQSRIGKWENGEGEPYMTQALRMAKRLGYTLDFLADDEQQEPPAPELTPGEASVLQLMRALGLDVDEALRRLSREPMVLGPRVATSVERMRFDDDPEPPSSTPRRRGPK